MDISLRPTAGRSFVLWAGAGSLGLFALLRLAWVEAYLLLPLTRAQAGLAGLLASTPASAVQVTLACSGADALALCLGAVLAYPVRWPARLTGAAGGLALILVLNTVRIGTLLRAAAWPVWFNALHVYVWPTILTLAIAGYVVGWMRFADRRQSARDDAVRTPILSSGRPQPTRRFIGMAAALLPLFAVASPLYLASSTVLAMAGLVAGAAARTLGLAGVTAHAAGNVLWTTGGGFLVTQECLATPLIPLYFAGIFAWSKTWPRLLLGAVAAIPLFLALGIVRLLLVALPGVASPLFFVHAFYQLLLGMVIVVLAALWQRGARHGLPRALVGIAVGVVFIASAGSWLRWVTGAPAIVTFPDPQGAIAFLPAFQLGLFLAVWVAAFTDVGWRRFAGGFVVLALSQVVFLIVVQALTSHFGFAAHVRDVRGWAIAGPLLALGAVVYGARPAR